MDLVASTPKRTDQITPLTQKERTLKTNEPGPRAKPVRIIPIWNMFEAQADPRKSKHPHALLKHARSMASVGCGGRLHGAFATRLHLRIPARRGDQASFERAALEHGRVLSWSCCRVATQPCWRGFYYASPALLEKKRNRYYLVLASRETGFPGEFQRFSFISEFRQNQTET